MAAALGFVDGKNVTPQGKNINLYTGSTYRLYVKVAGSKRFAPVDLKNQRTVGNLIYATLITPKTLEDLHELQDALRDIREQNPGCQAEYREVK